MNVFSKIREALSKTTPSKDGGYEREVLAPLTEEERENFAKWRERRL